MNAFHYLLQSVGHGVADVDDQFSLVTFDVDDTGIQSELAGGFVLESDPHSLAMDVETKMIIKEAYDLVGIFLAKSFVLKHVEDDGDGVHACFRSGCVGGNTFGCDLGGLAFVGDDCRSAVGYRVGDSASLYGDQLEISVSGEINLLGEIEGYHAFLTVDDREFGIRGET